MSAIETFSFGPYTLRPAGRDPGDLQLAQVWTSADRDHAGRVLPGFWLEQKLGRDSYILLDYNGPLFFFKLIQYVEPITNGKPMCEIHIQFPPAPGQAETQPLQRERLAMALHEGLQWLERVLIGNRIGEIFFDSSSDPLVAFCIKRLGFVLEGGKLRKRLEIVCHSSTAMERKT